MRTLKRILNRIRNVFTGRLDRELEYHQLQLTVFKNNLKTSLKERIEFCQQVIDKADSDNEMMKGIIKEDAVDKDKWIDRKGCYMSVLKHIEGGYSG